MNTSEKQVAGGTGDGGLQQGTEAEKPPAPPMVATGDPAPPPPKVPEYKSYDTYVDGIHGMLAVVGKSRDELGKRINAHRRLYPGALLEAEIESPMNGEKYTVWLDTSAVRLIASQHEHQTQSDLPPALRKILEAQQAQGHAPASIEDVLAGGFDPDEPKN